MFLSHISHVPGAQRPSVAAGHLLDSSDTEHFIVAEGSTGHTARPSFHRGPGACAAGAPTQTVLVPEAAGAGLAPTTHLHSSHIFPWGHPRPRIAQDLQTAPASLQVSSQAEPPAASRPVTWQVRWLLSPSLSSSRREVKALPILQGAVLQALPQLKFQEGLWTPALSYP